MNQMEIGMSNILLQSLIQSVNTCTYAPPQPIDDEEVLIRNVVANAFTQYQSRKGRKEGMASKHATHLAEGVKGADKKLLQRASAFAYGFATTYLYLFPNVPLGILGITGELFAIGVKDKWAESITIDMSTNIDDAYNNLAHTYTELDLYSGICKKWLRDEYDVVHSRVFLPRSGKSILVPCDGIHYDIAMSMEDDGEIYRRGPWCRDCALACAPMVEKRADVKRKAKSARITHTR